MMKKYRGMLIFGFLFFIIIITGIVCCKKNATDDPLTPDERKWLSEHDGKIKIADDPDWAPIVYDERNEDGTRKNIMKGISIDYIKLLEKKLRFKFKRIYPDPDEHWVEKARKKEIDVIGALQKTEYRSDFLNFTDPYLTVSNVIITGKNVKENLKLNKLRGRKIAFLENTPVAKFIEYEAPYFKMEKAIKDEYSIIAKVSLGDLDAGIMDLLTFSMIFEKNPMPNLRIAGKLDYEMEIRIASRKDWPILNQILKKGLALITPKERKAIRDKWITFDYPRAALPWYLLVIFAAILLIAVIALVWNRTLKRKKDSAEKSNHAKSLFIANMSHDLRTPLNAILGFAQILEEQIEDKKRKNQLLKIMRSGKFLLSLIDDILLLTIDDMKGIELEYHPVKIGDIFNEINDMFSLQLHQKGLDFEIYIDPYLPEYLMLDKKRLEKILLNLVGNAEKYSDAGYVKLSAYNYSEVKEKKSSIDLTISVEDTGIGIPADHIMEIFELFSQVHDPNKKKYSGTGLGLTIVDRWVKKMNGEISVKSKVGKGSTFNVTLKNIEIGNIHLFEAQSLFDVSSIEFKDSTILLVEDDEDNKEVVIGFLKPYNLKIIEAKNGKEGVNLAKVHKPNLILMDIKMPQLDGCEAAKLLKMEDDLKNIPIIAISAHAMEKDIIKAKDAGCDDFLRKPLEKWILVEILTNYLPNSKGPTTNRENRIEGDWVPSPEVMEELPALVNILENNFRERWNGLKKRWIKGKVRKFAEEIKELGNNFECKPLNDWAEKMLEKMDFDDYGDAIKILCDFPQQIELIEGYTRKN